MANGTFRAFGTFPRNTDQYPFYNEPLDIDIRVHGAVAEDRPAAPGEQANWTQHTWLNDLNWDPTVLGDMAPNKRRPMSPMIRYDYDQDLRRMGPSAPVTAQPHGRQHGATDRGRDRLGGAGRAAGRHRALTAIAAEAMGKGATVPDASGAAALPAGALMYEGHPL